MPAQDITASTGDSVTSLAHNNGFFWETIWNHPNNSELKQKRGDPNIIAVGDVVHIPEKVQKWESRATEAKHTFRRKGVPASFKIRMMKLGKPRANEDYVIEVDGQLISGTTDSDGKIEFEISPGARSGTLKFAGGKEKYHLNLGGLDPHDTPRGVQQRLRNLGYRLVRDADGNLNKPEVVDAIKRFQNRFGLPVTGVADQALFDKLKEVHQ